MAPLPPPSPEAISQLKDLLQQGLSLSLSLNAFVLCIANIYTHSMFLTILPPPCHTYLPTYIYVCLLILWYICISQPL